MAGEYIVDRASTYQHFLKVFALGMSEEEFENYDQESIKTKLEFFLEIKRGDSWLYYEPTSGKLVRAVRNVAILIYDRSRSVVWYEAEREYPTGKKVTNGMLELLRLLDGESGELKLRDVGLGSSWADYTYRETLVGNKDPLVGAKDGFAEELQEVCEQADCMPKTLEFIPWNEALVGKASQWFRSRIGTHYPIRQPEKIPDYDSSAYKKVVTRAWTYRFLLRLPRFLEGNRFTITDTGGALRTALNYVNTTFEAFPCEAFLC